MILDSRNASLVAAELAVDVADHADDCRCYECLNVGYWRLREEMVIAEVRGGDGENGPGCD
jgi:hypothetical protein